MSNARQIDLLLSGIFGLDGAPLSGGKVYCYNAGSSTLKNVYNDVGLTIASENPVILDENGKAIKYALGSYKLVIKDANDSTIYTYDNLTYGFNPESVTADYSGSIYLASMGGDSSAIQGSTTLTTPISSLANGMRFVFQSPFDCAANATIAIDNADAADLYIADGSGPVTAGYIEEGQFYEIIYDGSVFRVLSTTAAIGEDKIADYAVRGDKLEDYTVTGRKIAQGAITSFHISAESVSETALTQRAAYRNLCQSISTSGTHSAEEGKIFISSSVFSGAVTLNISDHKYYQGTPLFIAKLAGAPTMTVNILNIDSEVVSTYSVSSLLVIVKTAAQSWTKLHG